MTVCELIARLQKFDGKQEVVVNTASDLEAYSIAITNVKQGQGFVLIHAPADNPEDR